MALDTAKATVTLNILQQKFDSAVKAATPFYPNVSTIIDSTGADETYATLGGANGVREWLGDRQFKELRAGRFSIVNKKWESSELIAKDDIDDDRVGLYGPVMEQLAVEAAYHPDELLFSTMIAGATSACFDGQNFFDTDHAWGDSGTQDNDLTYAAATGTAPTAGEFRAAFHQARTAMLKFKNDQGKFLNRPITMGMSNLLAVVPPEMELAANEGLKASILSNNSNIVLDSPKIVVSPHITDAATFYLFNVGSPLKPFVFQRRKPLAREMKGLNDHETKDIKFMVDARYNVGYFAWWTGVLTTFT